MATLLELGKAGIIQIEADAGSLAFCPWCIEDTEYYRIKYPDFKQKVGKCRKCKKLWFATGQDQKRINRKGQSV